MPAPRHFHLTLSMLATLLCAGCASTGPGRLTAIGPHTVESSNGLRSCSTLDDGTLTPAGALQCAGTLRTAYIKDREQNLRARDRYESVVLASAVGTVVTTAFGANSDVPKALTLIGGTSASASAYRNDLGRAEANRLGYLGMSCIIEAGEALIATTSQIGVTLQALEHPGVPDLRDPTSMAMSLTIGDASRSKGRDDSEWRAATAAIGTVLSSTVGSTQLDAQSKTALKTDDDRRLAAQSAFAIENKTGPLAREIRQAIHRVYQQVDQLHRTGTVDFTTTRDGLRKLIDAGNQQAKAAQSLDNLVVAREGDPVTVNAASMIRQSLERLAAEFAALRACPVKP
jgi:hypothetical protein